MTTLQRDIDARTAEILGKPPRVAPLGQDEIDEGALDLVRRFRELVPVPEGTPVPESFAILARNPAQFRLFIETGLHYLPSGTLPDRDKELAILRTGWLCGAPFPFGEHVDRCKKYGVTSEDIERITIGSTAPGWTDHERAMIRAAEELHTDAMISDETWEVLSRTFDDAQLIELPFIVGHYVMVAFLQNSLRIRLRPGNPGLAGR